MLSHLGVQLEDVTETLDNNNQERWKVKQSIVLSFQIIQLGENDANSQESTGTAEVIDLKEQE